MCRTTHSPATTSAAHLAHTSHVGTPGSVLHSRCCHTFPSSPTLVSPEPSPAWLHSRSRAHLMVGVLPGNHELEPQGNGRYFLTNPWGLDNGRQFNSYLARVPISPLSAQSKGAPLYWSTEVGPVHYVSPSLHCSRRWLAALHPHSIQTACSLCRSSSTTMRTSWWAALSSSGSYRT